MLGWPDPKRRTKVSASADGPTASALAVAAAATAISLIVGFKVFPFGFVSTENYHMRKNAESPAARQTNRVNQLAIGGNAQIRAAVASISNQ